MGDIKAPPGAGSIHLCVDMQNLFAADGPWPTPWMEKVLPTIVRLAEHAPERTVFTRFIPPTSPEEAHGVWRAYFTKWETVTRARLDPRFIQLVPPLQKFIPPADVFDKPVYSAFFGSALHLRLRERKVDTLIVTGSETDVCVLSTVLGAVDYGYRIIVVKDGLCSSSDQSHDALLMLYAQRFDLQIELVEAEEILDAWKTVAL
jgi:nicotinamidase-related amidase